MEGVDPAAAEAAAAEGSRPVTCLFEASLLVASYALFYRFAWLYYRERLFPHHSFVTVANSARVLSLEATGRAFSLTFSLSCCIFELIILEIAGWLDPAFSPLAWRLCLVLMVVGLHVALPFLLAFACLGEMGFGRRPACVGAMVILSGVLFAASGLGHQDLPTRAADADAAPESRPPVFSLEAGLARVGVVGVASLALLSGFGAVNLPYQQLATLLRTVPLSLIKSRERRMRLTLKDIGQRKRRAAIASSYPATRGGAGGGGGKKGIPGGRGYGYGESPAAGGAARLSSQRGGLFARALRAAMAVVPGLSFHSAGSGSPFASSAQAAAEAQATASLEQIARELFLEISDCRRIQEQQRRARTLPGRVFVGFGAVMFVYCLLRFGTAGLSVFWAAPSSAGSIQGAADEGVSGGEGTGDDDPATRLVRFALSRHLVVDGDAEGWSELVSFVLIGVLVFLQTRGFLITITTVSRAFVMSGFSIPAQVLSLLLSMLMGTYFTSSVILMRVNLPPRHRLAITEVLGGMRFSFYQRWFDTVFLLSGCVTAVILLVFHLANRRFDADQGEAQPTTAAAAAANARIDMEEAFGAGEGEGGFGPDADPRVGNRQSSHGGGGYFSKGGGSFGIRPRGSGPSGWDNSGTFLSSGSNKDGGGLEGSSGWVDRKGSFFGSSRGRDGGSGISGSARERAGGRSSKQS